MSFISLIFLLLLSSLFDVHTTTTTKAQYNICFVNGDDASPTNNGSSSTFVPTISPTVNNNNNNIPITVEVITSPTITNQTTTLVPTMTDSELQVTDESNGFYRQDFILPSQINQTNSPNIFFNTTEVDIFTALLESYTPILLTMTTTSTNNTNITNNSTVSMNEGNNTNSSSTAIENGIIHTNCTVELQSGSVNNQSIINTIDYRCQYVATTTSPSSVSIDDLPILLYTYINSNLTAYTLDLQRNQLNVNTSLPVTIRIIQSPAPTTMMNTTSYPSYTPSVIPTEMIPTTNPNFIIIVPTAVTDQPSVLMKPNGNGSNNNGNNNNNNGNGNGSMTNSKSALGIGGVIAIVVVGGLFCLLLLYMFYNYKMMQQQQQKEKQQLYHQQQQMQLQLEPRYMNNNTSGSRNFYYDHRRGIGGSHAPIIINGPMLTNSEALQRPRRSFFPGRGSSSNSGGGGGNSRMSMNAFRSNRFIGGTNHDNSNNGPIMVPYPMNDIGNVTTYNDSNVQMMMMQQLPTGYHDPSNPNYVISPTDSQVSNKSNLSTGDSVIAEGSGIDVDDEIMEQDSNIDPNSSELLYNRNVEEDGTRHLQDEFDLYKDQNLETLRTDVEGNLPGFEGYMSAAVTSALIGDDEKKNYEIQDLLWGCESNPDGTEIEASALFEVTDWLTRNESAGMERKGAFMQEILNKMVTSVRFGVIIAEDASRTIHESAAILGLQLAEDLPVTTVIISGMRKTTLTKDMVNALSVFGDIDNAAVASGKRGFGIVRFRRRISVDQALQQYRTGEIVILDVSIQMKVLMPNGVLESR